MNTKTIIITTVVVAIIILLLVMLHRKSSFAFHTFLFFASFIILSGLVYDLMIINKYEHTEMEFGDLVTIFAIGVVSYTTVVGAIKYKEHYFPDDTDKYINKLYSADKDQYDSDEETFPV